jgi:CheY-like chemotaxis protein
MSTKTRVLHVRIVGFSAPERQMLNSIFLLSVAPARQIGYKLWNPESGVAPDMYLLDGDSDSAVASWQATFSSTQDRTLVVGAKNADLGVAATPRPLGLKVVGAMDRLAIALQSVAREPAGMDASSPRAGTLPSASMTASTSGASLPTSPKPESVPPRVPTGTTMQQPALSASMNSMAPVTSGHAASATLNAASSGATGAGAKLGNAAAAATLAGSTLSTAAAAASAASGLSSASGAIPTAAPQPPMVAAAPPATILPHVTLQPNVTPALDTEKPVTERAVDKILSDAGDKAESTLDKSALPPTSGATPLSPSALAAAVAPSPVRASLRVVPNTPPATPPLAASLPASARIADMPLNPPAPMAVPPAAAPASAASAAAAPAAPTVAPVVPVAPAGTPTPRHEEHNFRVLAVDDSPLMRTFLQNKLQPYGIQPEFASSGEEALFKISKQHFDLIFLDVMLPGMDGYDVCKMIKKNKDNHLMKVVMLTSKDKTFDKIRGTMAGCDGYLTKPVDELKLRAIIERHTVAR